MTEDDSNTQQPDSNIQETDLEQTPQENVATKTEATTTEQASTAALENEQETTNSGQNSSFAILTVVLLLATLAGVLLSYVNTNRRLASLETDLASMQRNLASVPQDTIEAIVAFQEGNPPPTQQAQEAPPTSGTVGLDDDAFMGDRSTAQLAIIEFSDFNCPFCARFHAETLPLLMDSYVRSGQAIYAYRDYVGVGGNVTLAAAAAAECVKSLSDDATYLEVVQGLYASSGTKNTNRVIELSSSYEIDQEALATCIAEDRFRQEVIDDTRAGQAVGARGTPAFIIGRIAADGSVTGTLLPGAQPFEVFQRVIDEQLAQLN